MGHQQKSYKKFVATAASATLVASAIVPVASASFSDVAENNEFATYINTAVEAGYVKGYEDGTFGINDNLKRSQVVIIIGRYLEKLGYTSEKTTSPWSDVTSEEVIKYGNIVKDAEVFTGYANGTLNGAGLITRENMAVVLDRLAKTVTGTSLSEVAADIEDVKVADLATANAAYQESIQALRDLGISTADNFNPKGNVKRGQFAKFIVTAVEKIDAIEVTPEVPEVTVEDIKAEIEAVDATLPVVEDITADNAEAAKAVVEAAKTAIAEIEAGIAEVELTEEVVAELNKAIEAVEAKYDAIVKAADKVIEAAKPLAVVSVTATNENTLSVTGEGLAKLKAADITIAGNTLTKVEVSEDGKTATVTLAGALLSGKEVNVAVKSGGETKEFKVAYNFQPAKVAVQAGSYDDDTANQRLTVLIDGVATSVDYLATAGYSVEFRAYNKLGANVSSTLFKTVTADYSADGVISTVNSTGEYTVTVVIKKGSEILTSEAAAISVRNLDNAAVVTEDYELRRVGLAPNNIVITDTLVVGESAQFTEFFVGNGDTVVDKGQPEVITSSNPAVIAVDTVTKQIKAVGLGTATIKATNGNATKEITITVKGEKRVAAAVKSTVIKPIIGGVQTAQVTVVDQYGNTVPTTALSKGATGSADQVVVEFPTSITGNAGFTATVSNTSAGVISLDFRTASVANETGTVVFKNALTGEVIGTATVQTTVVNNKNNIVLETIAPDTTINANDERDNAIDYSLSYYSTENLFNGSFSETEYIGHTLKFNEKVIKVSALDASNNATVITPDGNGAYKLDGAVNGFRVEALTQGTTTLSVYNPAGKLVASKNITVAKGQTAINGVTWKNPGTINYATDVNYDDVLTITKAAAGSDDIINGLTFTSAVVNKVRISDAAVGTVSGTGIEKGGLYLDVNDNGTFDDGTDTRVGALKVNVAADQAYLTPLAGTDGYTGATIVAGSKGVISFSLENAVGTVVSTYAVNVDVAQTLEQQQAAQDLADAKLAASKQVAGDYATADWAALQAALVLPEGTLDQKQTKVVAINAEILPVTAVTLSTLTYVVDAAGTGGKLQIAFTAPATVEVAKQTFTLGGQTGTLAANTTANTPLNVVFTTNPSAVTSTVKTGTLKVKVQGSAGSSKSGTQEFEIVYNGSTNTWTATQVNNK